MKFITAFLIMNGDIVIPVMIMTGFIALIAYSTIKDSHRKRPKEDPKEPPKFAHEPMDLRMKEE